MFLQRSWGCHEVAAPKNYIPPSRSLVVVYTGIGRKQPRVQKAVYEMSSYFCRFCRAQPAQPGPATQPSRWRQPHDTDDRSRGCPQLCELFKASRINDLPTRAEKKKPTARREARRGAARREGGANGGRKEAGLCDLGSSVDRKFGGFEDELVDWM